MGKAGRFAFVIPGILAAACAGLVACAGDGARTLSADDGPSSGPVEVAGPMSTCAITNATDATSCVAGRCAASVPPGAMAPGESISVLEQALPAELATDAVYPFLCELTVAGAPTRAITLGLDTQAVAAPNLALFERLAGDGGHAFVGSSVPHGAWVEALVTASGTFGITERPGHWTLSDTFVSDPLTSGDTASLVRNLSLQTINAAYWDGARLYVGSGPRVLVYEGIPAGPHVKPVRTLGQPELDRILPGTSASIMSGGVSGIWSDGTKLVVATGNRVLVWNALPTNDFEPANLVLGQQDFVTDRANVGGVSAATMNAPQSVDSDGTRLLVADTSNHRVLSWGTFPTMLGESASAVIGQPDTSTASPGLLYQAWSAALEGPGAIVASYYTGSFHFPALTANVLPDYAPIAHGTRRVQPDGIPLASAATRTPSGGIAVVDPFGVRIGVRRQGTPAEGPIDFVLGQPDATRTVVSAPNGSTIDPSAKAIAAHGLFLVPDRNRLLVWDTPPTYDFEPASRVVGQAGFSVNERGADHRRTSARTLAAPADVAADVGYTAVADRGNNRVLVWSGALANGAATAVLGQPDFASFVPNVDQRSPSANTLSGPAGVAIGPNHLVVADTENHRVLVWSPRPASTNAPPTFVLGQADFTSHRPNRGRGDANGDGRGDAAADGFFYPTGVATNGARLFVADRANNRVLVWDDMTSLSNGKAADRVLGQAAFDGTLPNRGNGGAGGYRPRLDGMNLPTGVLLVGSSLWVADTENNRVVRYDDALGAPTAAAVFGQPDGTTLANPNYFGDGTPNMGALLTPATTATSILRPRGIALGGGRLYVSETDSNRVHVLDATTGASVGIYGQTTGDLATVNAGGLGAGSLASPGGLAMFGNRLVVADAGNNRVLGWEVSGTPPLPLAAANVILGQTTFFANGFDQSTALTAGGAVRPRGMARIDDTLCVAETSRNRVVLRQLPLVSGQDPLRILGQVDGSVMLPNGGGAPTPSTLSAPRGVFATATRIFVADTGNSRVLVFPRSSTSDGPSAVRVLGQADFTSGAPNRGGAPSASTLAAPEGIYVDGDRIFVADTGNHRVLVWNADPVADGQPADAVLGQADFTARFANRGAAGATAGSLASPTAMTTIDGRLLVADAGNNRVLVWSTLPVTDDAGTNATAVLGQPAMTTRIPTADPNARDRLAGPVALTTDGTNVYVADRDANRVVAFDRANLVTGASATLLFNASGGLPAAGPAGLVALPGPNFTSRLLVADTNNDRILVLGAVSRLK